MGHGFLAFLETFVIIALALFFSLKLNPDPKDAELTIIVILGAIIMYDVILIRKRLSASGQEEE